MAHIQLVKGQNLKEGPPTGGMVRKEAFATDKVWVGKVHTPGGVQSGWHQHGDHDTYVYVVTGTIRLESGIEGKEITQVGAGDFALIPANTIHREGNPGPDESIGIVVRTGTGPTVFNVEGPQT